MFSSHICFVPKVSQYISQTWNTVKPTSALDMSLPLLAFSLYLLWALRSNTFFHLVWSILLLLLFHLIHHSPSNILIGIVSLLCLVLSPAQLILFPGKPIDPCDPLEVHTNGAGSGMDIYVEFVLSFPLPSFRVVDLDFSFSASLPFMVLNQTREQHGDRAATKQRGLTGCRISCMVLHRASGWHGSRAINHEATTRQHPHLVPIGFATS